MFLTHYSSRPIEKIKSRTQPIISIKPRGFWVSDDHEYGWEAFCLDNNYSHHVGSFDYQYSVSINKGSNILYIKTPQELIDFSGEFYHGGASPYGIDWAKVAEQYQGIIISPYQKFVRVKEWWYYGWDCASGCIWDSGAIDSIKLLRSQRQLLLTPLTV